MLLSCPRPRHFYFCLALINVRLRSKIYVAVKMLIDPVQYRLLVPYFLSDRDWAIPLIGSPTHVMT